MAEENFEIIGRDSGQNRASARTKERFQIEYQPVTDQDVHLLRDSYIKIRSSERGDGSSGTAESEAQFLAMGVSRAQFLMYQQIMSAIGQLSEKVDVVLDSMNGDRKEGSRFRKAMCVDLSATGLRMISGHLVHEGSFIKMILTLPPLHPVVVTAIGKIVKVNEVQLTSGKKAFETAIAFEVINEFDREEIVSYSFKRQREEAAKSFESGGS